MVEVWFQPLLTSGPDRFSTKKQPFELTVNQIIATHWVYGLIWLF